MFCASCGREIGEGAAFCAGCGAPVPSGPGNGASPGGGAAPQGAFPDEADVACFVGEKSGFYLREFRKFRLGRLETFTLTWNWSAFLFPASWLMYRKMYLWGVAALLAQWIPLFNWVTWIGVRVAGGLAGNYVYYLHARAKIREAGIAVPPDQAPGVIASLGGVNPWAAFLPVALLLGMLAFLAMIGAAILGLFGFGMLMSHGSRAI